MTPEAERQRLLSALSGMRRRGADLHELRHVRDLAAKTPDLPPEFHRRLAVWAEDFDETTHSEDLRVIGRLETLLAPQPRRVVQPRRSAPPPSPSQIPKADRARALQLCEQMRKIVRGAAQLEPVAKTRINARIAAVAEELARSAPRRPPAVMALGRLRDTQLRFAADIGPLARRAEELAELLGVDGEIPRGLGALLIRAAKFSLAAANFSLLALFPVSWFAPLIRAGLLPLFGLSEISVISGLQELWKEDVALALLVTVFAIAAPYIKTLGLALIHLGFASPRILPGLRFLGKLAMADVFLIALYILIVKGVGLATVETAWGLYLFTGCILVSLAISLVTNRRMRIGGHFGA